MKWSVSGCFDLTRKILFLPPPFFSLFFSLVFQKFEWKNQSFFLSFLREEARVEGERWEESKEKIKSSLLLWPHLTGENVSDQRGEERKLFSRSISVYFDRYFSYLLGYIVPFFFEWEISSSAWSLLYNCLFWTNRETIIWALTEIGTLFLLLNAYRKTNNEERMMNKNERYRIPAHFPFFSCDNKNDLFCICAYLTLLLL